MSNEDTRGFAAEARGDEPRAEVRRYFAALRRNWWLILAIVVVTTAAVVGISSAQPNSYEARATIVLELENSLLGLPDAESQQRRLATLDEQLTGSEVLAEAAAVVGGLSSDELRDSVEATVAPEANLIDVIATDGDPDTAAAIANAVAETFVVQQRRLDRSQIEAAIARLEAEARQDVQGFSDRLTDLRIQLAAAGSELQITELAEPPESPASPRPLRNGIVALFAALFLGILIALARDQFRPAITTPRELSRLTGLPILASVPYVGRRFTRHRRIVPVVEHEAYRSLASAVHLALSASKQSVILITSAVHAEGKTTVTARLSRALAEAGHNTLVISGDVRSPRLHELFDVSVKPGLTDLLGGVETEGNGVTVEEVRKALHNVSAPAGARRAGKLALIPSGSSAGDPARLLADQALGAFFQRIRSSRYKYVLVDSPPVLGMADAQRLASEADSVLLVSRLDSLTLDIVADLNEALGRLPATLLGHVVIGSRVEASPYYLAKRPDPAPDPPLKTESITDEL